MTRLWLRQSEHICDNDILQQISHDHWCWLYNLEKMTNITTRNHCLSNLIVSSNPLSRKSWEKKHKILNIVSTEIYIWSICRCSWNVASHKWQVHNGKLISPLLQQSFVHCQPWLSISRCRSRYEEDLPVSMAPMLNFWMKWKP